jgi:hypothetical protein
MPSVEFAVSLMMATVLAAAGAAASMATTALASRRGTIPPDRKRFIALFSPVKAEDRPKRLGKSPSA